MKFGFGFSRSTGSSSGGSSVGGGGGHVSRGRSKKFDDRPFPPQLEEHPYFNYFPAMMQQQHYPRYAPAPTKGGSTPSYFGGQPGGGPPPPPPLPPNMVYQGPPMMNRRRHGSFSNLDNFGPPKNGFHQRSRSSSGRFRQMKTPLNFQGGGGQMIHPQRLRGQSKSSDSILFGGQEPIYSEPLPPNNDSSEGLTPSPPGGEIKYYPDPHDPVQIHNHIYEYLVSKTNLNGGGKIQNGHNSKRRGSLSSSPSDGSSSTNNSNTLNNNNNINKANSQHAMDYSSGKPEIYFSLIF